jgi:hypothetical protein
MLARLATILIATTLVSGCTVFRGPRTVASEEPADKIPAIRDAVRRRDMRALPQLVKDLDHEDPAVRFYAGQALVRLTRQDFGYRFYDDEQARKEAVTRWQQWLSQQKK